MMKTLMRNAALILGAATTISMFAAPAMARRGADDPAGHVRQCRGCDDATEAQGDDSDKSRISERGRGRGRGGDNATRDNRVKSQGRGRGRGRGRGGDDSAG